MASHPPDHRPRTAPPAGRTSPILRIGHRGASAHAPENTLAAFEEAIRLGVEAVELDIHLSADGVPVVIHDETLDRTTDGRGPVASLRIAALRRLDAGSWFAPRFRGERIPTLQEALDCCRGRCGLNVEIKAEGARGAAALREATRAVARVLSRSRFAGILIVSSFSRSALAQARAAMPRARLGFLASRSAEGLARLNTEVGLFAFHPHHRLASRRLILRAQRLGLAVLVWPVNNPDLIRRLVERGADGLMTDDPALFASVSPWNQVAR